MQIGQSFVFKNEHEDIKYLGKNKQNFKLRTNNYSEENFDGRKVFMNTWNFKFFIKNPKFLLST